MKKIAKYILGAMFVGTTTLSFTSCDLDEYNPSGETADEVFKTPEGMEGLVNQLYEQYRKKQYGREDPCLLMEGAADIWQNIGSNYAYGNQLTRCVGLQGDRGQVANAWNHNYELVNYANAIINRLPDVVGATAEQLRDFEGEARFMRAYSYWWLVEYFGDIEMRTQETSTPEFAAYRTDRKTIYDEVIIPDAQKASELLPVNPYKGHVGRSTKKAAKALLARVFLTRAQYEAAGSQEQKNFYQKALDAALDVVNNKASYGIKLYATYDEIWQAKNNKSNTEFLWVTTFSSNPSLDADSKPNRVYRYFSPKLANNAGIKVTENSWEYPSEGTLLMPTYYFLNLWEDWDLRYDVIFQEAFPENVNVYKWKEADASNYLRTDLIGKKIMKGDTALYFTKKHLTDEFKLSKNYAAIDIDDVYETEHVNGFGGARLRNPEEDPEKSTPMIVSSFPRFMKYRIWDRDENGTFLLTQANGQFGFADVPVMRYAEMPLIAAECYIALGQQAEAAKIINKEIRNERVVKPGHSLSEAQVTANDMNIEWIMAERARELCGEWLRWFDMKRVYSPQGKFASTIVGRNPSMVKDDCMQEYHALRPIPNSFLDKLTNAGEFGQNPGYNPYLGKEEK